MIGINITSKRGEEGSGGGGEGAGREQITYRSRYLLTEGTETCEVLHVFVQGHISYFNLDLNQGPTRSRCKYSDH